MPDEDKGQDALLRQFEAAIAGLELADLRDLAGQLLAVGSRIPTPPPRPELRRPRRGDVAIYRLRVDLDHAQPPIWRRLDVRSDLTLDTVHQVLQAAFGWMDSHLHRFALGGNPFDYSSQLFLCPYDVEDGEDEGTPESEVRLDETLQDPGDVLRYVYDYGDSWELTLRLEQVLAGGPEAPFAVCVGGRRAAPPEDCGGITDAAELAEVLDDPAHFDPDEVNSALQGPFSLLAAPDIHPGLVDLIFRLQGTAVGEDLAERVSSLRAGREEPSSGQLAAALRRHLWFLERTGDDGLELTSAGYLKPEDVTAASAVVPTMAEWIGKNNREANAVPLLRFRQSLQALGLLRKYKGRLLLTRAGAAMRGDSERLFGHLASRLVPPEAGSFAQESALVALVYAATSGGTPVSLGRIAEALSELGWRRSDGEGIGSLSLYGLEPLQVLRDVSDRPVTFRDRNRYSPVAIALARIALMTGHV